ncbi:hypothetical protein [Inquilinus limosus]|uniref:hypothetical protein n=1 Tax=Inquilinus limosus TaxID=171674 RepID=UPI0004029656|nr:hypothetical protein [Inquilinus limosus]
MALEKAPAPQAGGTLFDETPCETIYALDSKQIMEQRWYKRFGGDEAGYRLHRDAAPARVEYHENGAVRREDWYRAGRYHQTERPAVTVYHPDGTPKFEWWFVADEAHREDGPAYVHYGRDGSRLERWYRYNQRHRTDGPAVIERDRDGVVRKAEWWLGGKEVTAAAEAFLAETGARWPFDPKTETRFLEQVLPRAA